MKRLERDAVFIDLLGRLKEEESWCGETHLQKATFFLQELAGVPLGFSFILYKHGPFSFDLRDELTAMRADGLISIQSNYPYGPSFVATPASNDLQVSQASAIEKYADRTSFVAKSLGKKQVVDLERVATALFVVKDSGKELTPASLAKRITALKPHIPREAATAAVKEVQGLIKRASDL